MKNLTILQSVLAAYAEEIGLTEEQALKIAYCLNSGMVPEESAKYTREYMHIREEILNIISSQNSQM